MIEKFISSLLINQTYDIKSSITGELYMDENRNSYLFFSERDALIFVQETPNVCLGDRKFRNPEEYFQQCYRYGILTVIISDGDTQEKWNLNRKNVKLDFYNNTLNAAITLFKETKNPKYLRIVASCYFIVPVRMDFDLSPEIVYGTIHMNQGEYRFLAFSDLEEYQAWGDEMIGWSPLLVNFDVMCQISKECGYVVNPKGNAVLMPAQVMSKYRKYAITEDPILV